MTLQYVGIDSAEITKVRITYRISQGGHGIPNADVERRYTENLKRLSEVCTICNLAVLYDNTKTFNLFVIYKNGIPCIIDNE